MVKTVMTFGDSNTYGTPPAQARGENRRFDPDVRWPGVMAGALGPDWQVIEEALPGRTTSLADPVMGVHMDGHLGLRIALESHGPIDVLTIMLGTNDAQTHHGQTADQIVAGLAGLLAIARSEPYQLRHGGFDILLIAPPPILEQGTYRDTLMGAAEKSGMFASLMAGLASHWGADFLDAGALVGSSPIDGLHLSAQDHAVLGQAVAQKLLDP
ncbi:MAG: SGNH/GDSL hydrolase family protein [Yoonia sp.]|uniref:SGNH/GDSL hydrolase family protein n=1 Tax=Yoonia sp. TaxID=2212373 RepID=UPI003EFA54AB